MDNNTLKINSEGIIQAIENSPITQMIRKLSSFIHENKKYLVEALDELNNAINTFPETTQQAMQLALREGWCFGFYNFCDLGEMISIGKNIISQPQETNSIMHEFYSQNIQEIKDELIKLHPHRKTAIESAINSHERGEEQGYFLSIPVFIAQTDGILSEFFNEKYMLTKRCKGKIQNYIDKKYCEEDDDIPMSLILTPLLQTYGSYFLANSEERKDSERFGALNRHEVMHGENSDYGNEENSMKALSFLAFSGISLYEADDSYKKEHKTE